MLVAAAAAAGPPPAGAGAAGGDSSSSGAGGQVLAVLSSEDRIDDGTPIKLTITIKRGGRRSSKTPVPLSDAADAGANGGAPGGAPGALASGGADADVWARFDWTGTGPQIYGNLNAPPAVTPPPPPPRHLAAL
jgi:hypothetical protein